jgi:hypothetical protein
MKLAYPGGGLWDWTHQLQWEARIQLNSWIQSFLIFSWSYYPCAYIKDTHLQRLSGLVCFTSFYSWIRLCLVENGCSFSCKLQLDMWIMVTAHALERGVQLEVMRLSLGSLPHLDSFFLSFYVLYCMFEADRHGQVLSVVWGPASTSF